MKIIVCVKQTTDTEASIKINTDKTDIETAGIKYIVNPFDEYALEEAIRIKEKLNTGTVIAISMGPERVKETLRNCLAVGANSVIHLKDDIFDSVDNFTTSFILAKAIKKESYDLILCGKYAVDDGSALIGGAIASHLNIGFVSGAIKIEVSDDQKKAKVHREIEGLTEIIEVELPAVISAEKGLNEPRYASLMGIMQAKKKEIKELTATDLELNKEDIEKLNKAKITKMEYPPKRPAGRMLGGEPKQVIAELVKELTEAKII